MKLAGIKGRSQTESRNKGRISSVKCMKRILAVLLIAIAPSAIAHAHAFSPPTLDWLPRSDAVYLVKVATNSEKAPGTASSTVTFSVEEAVRGKTRAPLVLHPYPDMYFDKYTEGSRWILIHNPQGFPNCVGWAMKGDCEWWPVRIEDKAGKPTAQWLGSLDDVRNYIHDHPGDIKPN